MQKFGLFDDFCSGCTNVTLENKFRSVSNYQSVAVFDFIIPANYMIIWNIFCLNASGSVIYGIILKVKYG